jgi:hypothetical protein
MFFHTKPSGFGIFNKNILLENSTPDNFISKDQVTFMESCKESLRKIEENKVEVKKPIQQVYENLKKADFGKELYEEYDQFTFENKTRVDMLYYENLMRKLPSEHGSSIEKILTELVRNTKSIYEFVNLKPEIYGRGIDSTIFEKPINEVNELLSKRIFEHLDLNFYNLDQDQRKNRYLEESRGEIKKLIKEGVDVDKSIEFGIKKVLIENLLTKISFPFTTWTRIKNLAESEEYGLVFDQGELLNLIETFENRISSLSKIIAALV